MKTPTPKAKAPRARVMYAQFPDLYMELAGYNVWGDGLPVAVIPCPTPRHARRIVKAAPFLALTEEEQVERLADAMITAPSYRAAARAVLAAVFGGKP